MDAIFSSTKFQPRHWPTSEPGSVSKHEEKAFFVGNLLIKTSQGAKNAGKFDLLMNIDHIYPSEKKFLKNSH